jgi:hypothetical protein
MKKTPESLRAEYRSSFAEIENTQDSQDAQDAVDAFFEHQELDPKDAFKKVFLEYYVQEKGIGNDFDRQVDKTIDRVRAVLCQDQHSRQLVAAMIAGTLAGLVQATGLPVFIVTGVLMYVLSIGIEDFCAINHQ